MRNYNVDSYIDRTKMVNNLHKFLNNVQPQFDELFKNGVKVKADNTLIKKQNDAVNQIIKEESAKCKDMMLRAYIEHHSTLHYLYVQIGYNTSKGTEYVKKQVYLYKTYFQFDDSKKDPKFIMTGNLPIVQPRTVVSKVEEVRARREKINELESKNRELCFTYDTFINYDDEMK